MIISVIKWSFSKITSKNPDYSLRTLQPLTPLNDDSTELTFVQAQLNSGEKAYGAVYSAANRCADLFKKFVGLVVFFGIALSVIPIIGIRLAEV
jgi:hypothetical protein